MNLRLEQVSTGDSLELRFNNNSAWIEIEEPWAGDFEYGFGRGCSFTISKDQARSLAVALLKWADA